MQVRPTRATTMSQSSQSNLVRLTMRARNRRAVKMVGPTERITASEYCSAGVCVGVRKEGIVFFLLRFVCPEEGSSVERHARNERSALAVEAFRRIATPPTGLTVWWYCAPLGRCTSDTDILASRPPSTGLVDAVLSADLAFFPRFPCVWSGSTWNHRFQPCAIHVPSPRCNTIIDC
jgi:hypothetical protein